MLRALLLELAKSSRLRRWITSNGTTRRLAQRFVPGEDLASAVDAARRSNQAGMTVSLDHLGENALARTPSAHARLTQMHLTGSLRKTSTPMYRSN
jgi:proline dehydrogenase